MAYKPILFNTEMVRAIIDGRKTQTRRIIRTRHGGELEIHDDPGGVSRLCKKCGTVCHGLTPPCEPGDILWVRETWHKDVRRYMYKASYEDDEKFYRNGEEVQIKWHPSIHMPKAAARIFLLVKNIRVEKLNAILAHAGEVAKEGIPYNDEGDIEASGLRFKELWDSTIKPADRDVYGWNANPWVWVIEFERCEKPEGWC